jgi:hypothetical protein
MAEDFQSVNPGETPALSDSPGPVETPPAAAQNEDLVLSQLNHRDLPSAVVEQLSQNTAIMKSRKVRLAIAAHPQAPRRIALRVIRELYTFELMQFALTPAAAADLRRLADELLVARVASITLGERISLARRSSEMVAAALLLDKATPVWQAALENPRLTERGVIQALQRSSATPTLVEAVSHHAKWSPRPEIRLALLRNPHTPLARALEFARRLQPALLGDILHTSKLPEQAKAYLKKNCLRKTTRTGD